MKLKIRDGEDFIRLGQALKAARLVDEGADAKYAIRDGQVKVNGEVELQRGKKLHGGDVVSYRNDTIEIEGPGESRNDV